MRVERRAAGAVAVFHAVDGGEEDLLKAHAALVVTLRTRGAGREGGGGEGEHPAAPGHCRGRGGGIVRAGEYMNLQILARQNLCHFFKMSEQVMYGSQ